MFSLTSLILTAALLASSERRPVPPTMAVIPAGSYVPLYGAAQKVDAFALDRLPVTRGEFLAFVRTRSEWRRGAVDSTRADATYLAEWPSALSAGDADDLRRPVVNVSWFAASAYCSAQGKRLATTAEWERAAAASATRQDATRDPAFRDAILAAYTTRGSAGMVGRTRPNVYGISDLHELVWEWTSDFSGPAASAHQHAAHGHGETPAGCASAAIGASDATNYPAFLRTAVRQGLTRRSSTQHLGFRCAMSLA